MGQLRVMQMSSLGALVKTPGASRSQASSQGGESRRWECSVKPRRLLIDDPGDDGQMPNRRLQESSRCHEEMLSRSHPRRTTNMAALSETDQPGSAKGREQRL